MILAGQVCNLCRSPAPEGYCPGPTSQLQLWSPKADRSWRRLLHNDHQGWKGTFLSLPLCLPALWQAISKPIVENARLIESTVSCHLGDLQSIDFLVTSLSTIAMEKLETPLLPQDELQCEIAKLMNLKSKSPSLHCRTSPLPKSSWTYPPGHYTACCKTASSWMLTWTRSCTTSTRSGPLNCTSTTPMHGELLFCHIAAAFAGALKLSVVKFLKPLPAFHLQDWVQ